MMMDAETISNDWRVQVWITDPFLGFTIETRIVRPDGSWIVMSRDIELANAYEDMQSAAFAIAAVLDPEHNGPWQEGPGPVGAQQSDDDKEQNL